VGGERESVTLIPPSVKPYGTTTDVLGKTQAPVGLGDTVCVTVQFNTTK
jgi:hypothetical protein